MSDGTPVGREQDQQAGASQAAGSPSHAEPVPKKTQRPWLLLVALAVLALVAVVFGVLRAPRPESPEHALRQLSKAAENKDWGGVQKYMDVDAVATHYVDVALSNALGDDGADGAGAMAGGNAMGASSGGVGVGRTMKPVFVQRFRDSLKKRVEEGTLKADAGGVASVLRGKKPKRVSYVSRKEASASVEVPAGAGGTREVTLRMEWADDHWRIVALENIGELLGPSD